MRITLIRHGKTAGNAEGRYVGRTDVSLCEEGRREAEQAGTDPQVRSVYVSPLRRTHETAAILFPNAEQIVIDGLCEMDFGAFEGRTAKEMENDPVYRQWVDDLCLGACPGGESQTGFRTRVSAAFADALQTVADGSVFVLHGGVIMAIMAEYAEPKKGFYDWIAPNLGGFSFDAVRENGRIRLRNVRPVQMNGGADEAKGAQR